MLTEWYVVITVDWNVLLDLDVVDALEDCKSVAHAWDSHLLQILVLKCHQSLTNNLVFYFLMSFRRIS